MFDLTWSYLLLSFCGEAGKEEEEEIEVGPPGEQEAGQKICVCRVCACACVCHDTNK